MSDHLKTEHFWVKYNKFVQEFKQIEILQLRINHNFTNIILDNQATQFSIVSLEFEESSFGSIALSNKEFSGSLTAFLYREEKNNLLKLVGKAK